MKKRVLRWLSLLLASLTVALTLISCEGSVGSVTQLSFVNSTSFVIEELILYKSDNSESVILKTTTIDAGGTLDYKIRWSEDYLTSRAEIYVAASSEENGTRYIRKTVDC
ncbi:MAG: hypothetical protein LUH54_02945, partial [Firmicutes bacterium]|nr:hypothetical protein [Bacillota bacterium]